MGLLLSRMLDYFSHNEARVAMLGLDAAGKTTILYKLKLGEVISSIPTIGFNVETIQYKKLTMTVWDVGGQSKIRPLWRYYYEDLSALVYVCDSADVERLAESREELNMMLADDHLRGVPLLVYANKQDAVGALKPSEISSRLGLSDIRDRPWYIQASSAINSEGLYEGLDWVSQELKKRA
eukprot:m.352096 g.352096  ORF g.352096 m.352096 type:complete len:181 (+) comp16439_c0_seq1:486-1028(+)